MVTLADLKAKHPEWCFNCGHPMCRLAPPIIVDGKTVQCTHSHTLAALIAKALEDEARIEELQKELAEEVECGDRKQTLYSRTFTARRG